MEASEKLNETCGESIYADLDLVEESVFCHLRCIGEIRFPLC